MAQYFYDPADDTVGSPPVGWTSEYETFGTLNVANDGTRNYVETARSTNTTAHAISYDAVGDVTDVEVFALIVEPVDMSGFERHALVFLRGTGSSDATANAYAVGTYGGTDGTSEVAIRRNRFLTGTFNGDQVQESFVRTTLTPYAVRLNITSTTISSKYWTPADPWGDPTADEPANWTGTSNASDITGAGFVGWGGYIFSPTAANSPRLYAFGVGTAGDPAPSAAATNQLSTPTGFTFTAGSAVRTLDGSWNVVSGAATYDWQVEKDVSGGWTAFQSGNTASTAFQITDVDGVDWGTTYRGRVRAVPA